MNIQQKSRNEYLRRINRVVDHIEANLAEDHSLESLAGVAHFSPFHFHRVFKALTGETIHSYVRRIRLQHAGRLLLSDYDAPVNDIAHRCGFNSPEVFCRAFRGHFGSNTGAFREQHRSISKNHQKASNTGQSLSVNPLYIGEEYLNQQNNVHMKNNIEIRQMPPLDLVYCRHTGPFDQIAGAYEKLFRWAGPRGLLKFPETKTVTVYHDDPKVVDIRMLRQSACITVSGEVETGGEFGSMHLPGSVCAVGHFRVTPDQFSEAWDEVCRWLADSGYLPSDGLPYEYYPEEHEAGPPPVFTVDICIPVKSM